MLVASSKQSVQLASQTLESVKSHLERVRSEKSSAEKELSEANQYLKAEEAKYQTSVEEKTRSDLRKRREEKDTGDAPKKKKSRRDGSYRIFVMRRIMDSESEAIGIDALVVDQALSLDGRGASRRERIEQRLKSIQHEHVIQVKSSDTIQDIKGKIVPKNLCFHLYPDAHVLRYGGTILEGHRTLSDCNIPKRSVLSLTFDMDTPMQVHVKTLDGKTITVRVKLIDWVSDIKDEIRRQEGILPERQRLIYRGRELLDDDDLLACGITSQSTLQLVTVAEIPIRVENVSGQTFTLTVAISDKVKQVKQMLEDKTGVPANLQRLIFAGSVLEDSQPLSHYNVQRESTLHLVRER